MVSPLRPENDFRRYCCVSCLAPTQTLLTQYSTRSALKLTRCQTCGLDVDPYVEREELLVSFDLILHRIAAYRHVLFNRDPLADFEIRRYRVRAVKISLGVALLDAYIKFEAIRFANFSNDCVPEEEDTTLFFLLVATSFFELFFLLLGSIVAIQPILSTSNKSYFSSKMALAIVLPCTFKAITIFVTIWENSPTTRLLGSLFVLTMQWMGAHTIVERIMVVSKGKSSLEPLYACMPGSPLIIGILLRAMFSAFARCTFGTVYRLHQCSSGINVTIWMDSDQTSICLI